MCAIRIGSTVGSSTRVVVGNGGAREVVLA
ncbi:Uncharacterised protein [Mycobacteroides abscessus subsp. abscessus]|nr:Uncharacterised protein [Mycobacteroides abscessus subsp. abscessus]